LQIAKNSPKALLETAAHPGSAKKGFANAPEGEEFATLKHIRQHAHNKPMNPLCMKSCLPHVVGFGIGI
jgi:hypothetical protein